MKYKLAIFDLDGTILNTIEDLCDTMNYSLSKNNMPTISIEDARRMVGNGIHRFVEEAVAAGNSIGNANNESNNQIVEAVFKTFHEHYKDHCAIKTRPYDGIVNLLQSIRDKGIKTAVVSNKADYAVKSLCDDYFKGLFDYSVGDKEGQRRKPYPDSVNMTMKHFGVDKSETVYIGDSEVDYKTAQNAGVDAFIVGWGFRDKEYLSSFGVTKVICDMNELQDKILEDK